MHRVVSKRDYYIYIYGLNRAGIDYDEIKSSNIILIPNKLVTEVEIMKDQLLSEGVFSIKEGHIPHIPVEYNMISEIDDMCLYKVEDPNNEVFRGINAQTYVTKDFLVG